MEKTYTLDTYTMEQINNFCGVGEEHLELLAEYLSVEYTFRGNSLTITGDEENIHKATKAIEAILKLIRKGKVISKRDVIYTSQIAGQEEIDHLDELYEIKVGRTVTGKLIYPKTMGQKAYYYALKKNDVVFGIGPAGTGKTYLAVVFAVMALKAGEVQKIILTRPAVEAGESLGFLPGDLKEKVDPYLRPLYDALYDMLGAETTERLIEKGTIEIAPLAYMRGRTLEDAYVILDEAQNTTVNQMKMFLTRLGFHSKMVITGDISQIDLPRGQESGLKNAISLLKDVKGIRFVYMSALDVVRHPVVQRIIERYEQNS